MLPPQSKIFQDDSHQEGHPEIVPAFQAIPRDATPIVRGEIRNVFIYYM